MSRDEDDLMKDENQNDDFEFDDGAEDNLSIPDTPYGQDDLDHEDDLIGSADEEFDLGEGLGETLDEHESLDDLAGLGEDGEGDSQQVYADDNEKAERDEQGEPEWEDEEPEAFSLGWKSYLSIGVTAVVVVIGLAMVMFGGGSEPSQPRQAMSPEELQRVSSRSNGQQESSPQAQSGAADEPTRATQQPDQAGGSNSTDPNSPAVGAPEPGRSGGEFSDRDSGDPVIGRPGRETSESVVASEQDILDVVENEFVGLNDFKALRGTVNTQARRISRIDTGLSETQGSLRTLEERVAELEDRGYPVASSDDEGGSGQDESSEVQPSDEVREAQIRLKAFNYRPGPIDGLMGGRTESAIKRFQRQHDIKVTGELDEDTLNKLNNDPQLFSGSYRSTPKQAARSQSNQSDADRWYVRGVTSARAIIYQVAGRSYAVSEGSEVPGFGQVTQLDPRKHKVVTTKGTIGLK